MKFKVFQSIPEVLTYTLLIAVLTLNIIVLVSGQKFQANAQHQTLIARQQNAERQNELKSYIECVVLIGKSNPNFDFKDANFDQTKTVLDQCATITN